MEMGMLEKSMQSLASDDVCFSGGRVVVGVNQKVSSSSSSSNSSSRVLTCTCTYEEEMNIEEEVD